MVESSEVTSSSRLERLERIYEENPGTRLFLALAEEFFRDGQLEKAVEVCRGGLESYPGYTSARVTLARSLVELGQDAEAEQELGAVLDNSPDNLLASRLFAGLLIRLGRREEAATEINRLLGLSPDDEEGLRLRRQLEQPPQTKPVLATVPPDVPPPTEPVPATDLETPQIKTSTLARLYEEQGLLEKALGVYDTLLAADPDNVGLADRAAVLRTRIAGNGVGPPVDGDPDSAESAAADADRQKIERLGRWLDAARAVSAAPPENE